MAQTLKDHLQKGDRYYQRKDYSNALQNYREALVLDADDPLVNFKAGISSLNTENYHAALTYLETAYRLKPDVDANIDYHLAMAYQENHQYGKAVEHYTVFRSRYKNLAGVANQKIRECTLADSLMKIPVHATVGPVDELNTPFAEFFPVITADGNQMIFTSNRSVDNYQIKSSTNFDDVYVSRDEGGKWGPPEKIGSNINVKLNEAATSISPDGRTLFLYFEEGKGDIYTSSYEDGEWSTPVPLNRFVNHPHFRESSACVSPDGQRLYFSSNRPGGKGGYDIYFCVLGSNGEWGRPTNLGAPINTRGDEEYPFLHTDGVTLYFSSNGHPTLGSHDIYRSVLREKHWSTPAHLGFPINTRGYEGGFILVADGKTGYFASRRGTSPDQTDLYRVTFRTAMIPADRPESAQVQRVAPSQKERGIVAVLKGTVIDVKSTQPLEATIRLVDNTSNMVISTIKTGPSGNFELVIPQAGDYGVTTERNGYLFNSMHFDLPAFDTYQEIDTHILMVKAEVGSKIVLKNVFFDLNRSELKPESLSELKNVRDLLILNPSWRIQVNGHTDNVGHPKTNMELSLRRAQAVVQFLIEEGIDASRLQAKGFGSDKPLVSNDDENEGRQINRRTEIEIID